MTLQSELNHVTDLVISRRRELAEAELRRLAAKRAADLAAEELETARRQLMTRAEAGSNDNQRRAYAERESRRERRRLRPWPCPQCASWTWPASCAWRSRS